MGQIVKKKKKGRPSKADLARRSSESQANTQSELRRSLRRRNVRYNVDYDDYLDEYDEDEDEDERRREKKKLKLVVKLNQGKDEDESAPSLTRAGARGDHAISASDDDGSERKPLKKRRINGGRYSNEEGKEEQEEEEEEGEENEGDEGNEDEYENNHAQEDGVDAAAAGVSVVELYHYYNTSNFDPKRINEAVSEREQECVDQIQYSGSQRVYQRVSSSAEITEGFFLFSTIGPLFNILLYLFLSLGLSLCLCRDFEREIN